MDNQELYINEAILEGVLVEAVDAAVEQIYIPTEEEINAYFLKAFRYAQDRCVGGNIELTITARAHNSANTIAVVYRAEVGEWEKLQNFKSDSLNTSVMKATDRYHESCACEVKAIPVF